MVISNKYQHHGLGSKMCGLLIQVGRAEKLARLTAAMMPESTDMQQICAKLGFTITHHDDKGFILAEIAL